MITDDDELAGVLGALGHLQRGPHRGARRDADQQAFLAGQAAGGVEGVVVGHLTTSS
jgi:hypothetical protein